MTDPAPAPEAPDTSEFDVTVAVDGLKEAATKGRFTEAPKVRSPNLLLDNDGWIDGKFRLLEKLGEGGFGLVFKAEQIQPIHRLVAVKILKAGMDTQQVIARFATERQSLALMEHPNIARVLDAGETERGQPYFVMELVRGRSITSYSKKKALTIPQRIELFILVCQAVNHAHQKGIIHRDLKPSNVMVMEEDGVPTPKVIDFGIAKVLEQKDVSQTLATGMDQLVGTPGYISPEQIEHGSSHVDTRSDVYALGSILMELLSGKPLISAMDVAQKPLHQILRDQVELDPPRPSTREPLLKGDLDWIILKALEKDPARRYGNADDLADDLRRYLHDEPVKACPPSRGYLIGKFVRRHRVGVAAGLAVALAVLAGGITSTALYFEAVRNRQETLRASSASDGRMAGKLTELTDYTSSVTLLCRALRTDPENGIAATNLLSLLEHEHLIQPATPELPLPQGTTEARLVALSPQAGRVLAISSPRASPTAPAQDVLSLWDMTTHKRTDHLLPGGVVVTSMLVSKDGRHVWLARDDGQVMRWTLADDTSSLLGLRMPAGTASAQQSALCLALSGDGHLLAAGGDDGTILVWDLRQPDQPGRSFRQAPPAGMKTPITSLQIDHQGSIIASTSNAVVEGQSVTKGIVSVWEAASGKLIGDSIQVDDGISALALDRGKERIAIGLHSGVVHVLHYRLLQEVVPDLQHPSAVTSLSFSDDADTLTVGDGGGYLHTWDLSRGRPRFPAQGNDGEIMLMQRAQEHAILTTVSRHGELQVWNTQTGDRMRHRLQHSLSEASVSADGSMLVMAPRYDAHVQVWSIRRRMATRCFLASPDEPYRKQPDLPSRAPEPLRKAAALGWNATGSLAAAADAEGRVIVINPQTGRASGPAIQHPPAVGAVALSGDGHLLATSGRDQEVRLWDVASGKSTGIVIRPENFVSALALTPDGKRLVTVTDDGQIRVWETQFGNCLTPAIHAGAGIAEVHLAEEGRRLVYRVAKEGWFSLPMPPESARLPEWFLDLAESLARRRLTSEGKTESLTLDDLKKAVAAVPKQAGEDDALALRWAQWLMAAPEKRPLSPQEDEMFEDYLKALPKNTAASAEVLRFRSAAD